MPQRAGVEIPSKPLLMHWMAALVSIVAGGVNEFSVRLPSAGLAIAGVIVCYFYVRRLFDDVISTLSPRSSSPPLFSICKPAPERASI